MNLQKPVRRSFSEPYIFLIILSYMCGKKERMTMNRLLISGNTIPRLTLAEEKKAVEACNKVICGFYDLC